MASGSVVPIDGLEDAKRFFAVRPLAKAITCEFDFGIGNPLY